MQEARSVKRIDPLKNKILKKNNKKVVPDVLVMNCNPCLKGLRTQIMKYWDKTQNYEVCKKKNKYSQHLKWLHTVNTEI